MGKAYNYVPERFHDFVHKQKIFFVGTANLHAEGHINISPKGHDSFVLINKNKCAYIDLTGSGSETAAHLMQKGNGRITIMFCSFDGAPNILRLFGKGTIYLPQNAPKSLLSHFPQDMVDDRGFRSIVSIDIHRVSSSCGYAVPLYEYKEDRQGLRNFFKKKTKKWVEEFRVKRNSYSIDGCPSVGLHQQSIKRNNIEAYDGNGYVLGRVKGSKPAEVKSDVKANLTKGAYSLLKNGGEVVSSYKPPVHRTQSALPDILVSSIALVIPIALYLILPL
ncbi:hypothetical protein AAMO2058_001301400 [Amorphochlora amoebiformis]